MGLKGICNSEMELMVETKIKSYLRVSMIGYNDSDNQYLRLHVNLYIQNIFPYLFCIIIN